MLGSQPVAKIAEKPARQNPQKTLKKINGMADENVQKLDTIPFCTCTTLS